MWFMALFHRLIVRQRGRKISKSWLSVRHVQKKAPDWPGLCMQQFSYGRQDDGNHCGSPLRMVPPAQFHTTLPPPVSAVSVTVAVFMALLAA
jgi:hypothetical protein